MLSPMLEKDLEEIAELEAANEELEAYRAQLAAVPPAPPSDAALALLAEDDAPPESTSDPFRAQDAAVAARKAALLATNKSLRVAVDARESGPYVAVAAPAPARMLPTWVKLSWPLAVVLGIMFLAAVPTLLRGCAGE